MNISRENIDELNAKLRVKLTKEDYEEKIENVLKDYRRKASLNGFRPGKVPFGLINKMYRKPVLVEEINKIIGESISKYITDEKLKERIIKLLLSLDLGHLAFASIGVSF